MALHGQLQSCCFKLALVDHDPLVDNLGELLIGITWSVNQQKDLLLIFIR